MGTIRSEKAKEFLPRVFEAEYKAEFKGWMEILITVKNEGEAKELY